MLTVTLTMSQTMQRSEHRIDLMLLPEAGARERANVQLHIETIRDR